MNKSYRFFTVSFVALCACAPVLAAQNAPTFMSKYGEIQSVNKYSSNPFWSPDSPYNQRFPTPIYASGPDVNTGDCNRIVQNLITEYCASRGNCANARISDIRPHIMVSLSQLPGHNFATSCGGYIDTVFENYKKTYGNSSTGTVNIVPTQNKVAAPSIQIENPFKQTKSVAEIAMDTRTAELENFQRQTTPTATIAPAAFPKTIDDLSFTDRMANTSAGYEPYKDLKAYKTPKFETEDEYYERMKSVLTHNISYIGAGAKECPPTYMTGRGATVSCTPTINHGTCSEWCTDAALTNCQTSYTISPNDRDDKTFYANCICNDGYEMDGYKCVKPGAPVAPVDPVDPVDSPITNCSHPTYMDSNCECTVVPNTHEESGKCVCDNGNDITNNCANTPTPDATYFMFWDCLGTPAHHANLINARNNGDTGVSIRRANCMPRPGRSSTRNCIAHLNNPTNGVINKLYSKVIPDQLIYRSGEMSYVLSNKDTSNYDFTLSESQVDSFIDNIIANITDVKKECTSDWGRAWRLFIDKHIITGGVHEYKPYKTICIGGMCQAGEVKEH